MDFRTLTFVTPSSQQLVVTDSRGNRTGYDDQTGNSLDEIPNSQYVFEAFYGGQGDTPSDNGMYHLTINYPEDGVYQLETFGDNPEPVAVYSNSSDAIDHKISTFVSPERGLDYKFLL